MPKTSAPYMSVGKTFTLEAGADLSALQFTCIKLDAAGLVEGATAATTPIIGILLNDPIEGLEAVIGAFGIYPVRAGAAFNEGDKLTSDGAGELIATTTANDWIVGVALGASGGANEIVPALIGPFGNL